MEHLLKALRGGENDDGVNDGIEPSPRDVLTMAATIRLTRLVLCNGQRSEIAQAKEVLLDLNPNINLPPMGPASRGRGRPKNRRAELVYDAARMVWVHQLGQTWTRSSSDRRCGPLFDGGPGNRAARFLCAFAREVDPSITAKNCSGVHERLRKERYTSKMAQALEHLRRDVAQDLRKAEEVCAWWNAYQRELDANPALLAEIEAAMAATAR